MRRILVVHAVPNLQRQAGGIAGVVPPLCEALKAASIESIVLTFAVDPDQRIRGQVSSEMEPTAVMLEHSINSWSVAETIASEVSELRFSHPEIVLHNHGLWHPLNHALALVARRLRRPMITSLHGALLPWARAHSGQRRPLLGGSTRLGISPWRPRSTSHPNTSANNSSRQVSRLRHPLSNSEWISATLWPRQPRKVLSG